MGTYNSGPGHGYDIRLYFADSCGQILHDTILYRWSFSGPLDERGVKLLVNHDGNYVIYGHGDEGPLGSSDIFVLIYKKWDGFNVDTVEIPDTNHVDTIVITTEISIYPNPAQNQFIITGITENNSITVMDMLGRITYQTTSSTNLTAINTTHWARGIYMVHVKGSQSSATLKVIKQ
jgi:hypothetical protein